MGSTVAMGSTTGSTMDLVNDNAEESMRHWEPPSSRVGNDKLRVVDPGADPIAGLKWAWYQACQLAP